MERPLCQKVTVTICRVPCQEERFWLSRRLNVNESRSANRKLWNSPHAGTSFDFIFIMTAKAVADLPMDLSVHRDGMSTNGSTIPSASNVLTPGTVLVTSASGLPVKQNVKMIDYLVAEQARLDMAHQQKLKQDRRGAAEMVRSRERQKKRKKMGNLTIPTEATLMVSAVTTPHFPQAVAPQSTTSFADSKNLLPLPSKADNTVLLMEKKPKSVHPENGKETGLQDQICAPGDPGVADDVQWKSLDQPSLTFQVDASVAEGAKPAENGKKKRSKPKLKAAALLEPKLGDSVGERVVSTKPKKSRKRKSSTAGLDAPGSAGDVACVLQAGGVSLQAALGMIESALNVNVPIKDLSPAPTKQRSKSEVPRTPEVACCEGCLFVGSEVPYFQIGCDGPCKKWYHGSCVCVTEMQAELISKFHCEACQKSSAVGPSIRKKKLNNHRHNYLEKNAEDKPTQTGTAKFLQELKERDAKFKPLTDAVETMRGRDIDIDYMRECGFKKLILIEEKSGLDIILPDENFGYHNVAEILGADKVVSAIDVESQEENLVVTLGQFVKYMDSPQPRDTTINIISLEFSKSAMSKLVEPPLVVRTLSWVDQYFQDDEEEPPESPYAKPEVQKYCLMSPENSFTDFHIDFGGTSVWYHIFKGRKIFYLIPPTDENLMKYEMWMRSPPAEQSSTFLGDKCDCYRLELKEGNTILMPSGWIHAVLTPQDSLVFGGNFLHDLAVEYQFKINQMEDRLETPERYRFPHFYTVCWEAFQDLVSRLEDFRDHPKDAPKWLLKAVSTLYNTLQENSSDSVSQEELKRRKDELTPHADVSGTLKKTREFMKLFATHMNFGAETED
ncbi:Lysine-specific demethylase 7A [Hypsibius exemplaris]|uniref:Lysine-specific demethylase 7A n=1 Tax=Hypsibius exemplaris TaxID=2072580 RepID=A0A1W0X8T8_HYPEX|nr:Lysine-specific demethylase 7A [Hypsibius exemplaris]